MRDISINTEDFIFIIIIIAVVLNIIGNNYKRKNNNITANKYYLTSLIVTIIVYFYFLYNNYRDYKSCDINQKKLFLIKLLGVSFLISGALCLLYFQINDPDFNIAPVL